MDRLGFWGPAGPGDGEHSARFQYPLMDRLGFWGVARRGRAGAISDFSIR